MNAQTSAPNARSDETAEITAALQGQDIVAQDFEQSLQSALAATGGLLLFQMRIDQLDKHENVAAISIGAGDERRFFLIILPSSDGVLRVEPVESSDNPLARIAAAYAGLADVLRTAA